MEYFALETLKVHSEISTLSMLAAILVVCCLPLQVVKTQIMINKTLS